MRQKVSIRKKSLINKKKEETTPNYSTGIKLPEFEGPLDLLLTLIKKNKINIYDIPINKITEDYLNTIGLTEDNLNSSINIDIDLGGDFIVMAAHLIYIKSLMLLPSSIDNGEILLDENKDPRESLVNMLLEYRKVKDLSDFLENRPILGRDVFNINININNKKNFLEQPEGLELINKSYSETLYEANVFILSKTFYDIVCEVKKRDSFYELKKQKFSIREKIIEIIETLGNLKAITLSELILKSKNRERFNAAAGGTTFIVYFLAILEMARLAIINLQQVEDFGEIYISLLEDSLLDYHVKIENIA